MRRMGDYATPNSTDCDDTIGQILGSASMGELLKLELGTIHKHWKKGVHHQNTKVLSG
jgi:hypothetical protein